ncbi:unnamed protein product [Bursaphelenchus okinawaensis]|uniref:Transmembrane protein n=1 Tax=Bursaphelenchus okinawaensis TaxID=465554 RepID=A0A811JQJ1_9BILA|nr:unnamed protein product [Bursaphelenchus okinawaensis]CAG9077404.1 unnamed protein product [Bursaphelenchus okinawaensis]
MNRLVGLLYLFLLISLFLNVNGEDSEKSSLSSSEVRSTTRSTVRSTKPFSGNVAQYKTIDLPFSTKEYELYCLAASCLFPLALNAIFFLIAYIKARLSAPSKPSPTILARLKANDMEDYKAGRQRWLKPPLKGGPYPEFMFEDEGKSVEDVGTVMGAAGTTNETENADTPSPSAPAAPAT